MFKEEGYDEFLAQKIQEGKAALARGEIVSREQALIEIRQAILRKEQELVRQEQLSQSGLIYG